MNSPWLKWLHRWLGLALGLLLSVVSLSGSWLIYERELSRPDHVLATQPQKLSLQRLYQQALQVLPEGSSVMLRFPQRDDQPYQFWSTGPSQQRVFIDPFDGRILAVQKPDYWPYGWMFELHTALLQGKSGEALVGWLGMGFLLMTLLGMVLWLPRNWRSAWRFRMRDSRFLRHYDLHRQFGMLVAPLLLLAFVTGISLNFSEFTGSLLNRIAGTEAQAAPAIVATQQTPRASLDALADAANRALPGGRIGIIILGQGNQPVTVRKQLANDPHPNGLNFIYLDPASAEVVKVVPVTEADAGRRWFNWAYPLHTGQALQPWHQWLLFTCGLLPPGLLFTGLTMYLIRRKAMRKRTG